MIRPEVCTHDGQPIMGKATFEEHVEYQATKEYNRCLHFRGVQHGSCHAGIVYVRGMPLPCWRNAPPAAPPCPLQHFPTEDEALCMARETMAEISAALWTFKQRKANKQCVQCGHALSRLHQSGPCVYGFPCGHRQWQGTIPTE